MKNNTKVTEAGLQYTTAYTTHYTKKELYEALKQYKDIIDAYPDTPEADYSHSQIQNIVNTVIPKQKRIDAQLNLAITYFEQKSGPFTASVS